MNYASANFEKLTTIDSIGTSSIDKGIPEAETQKLIDILVPSRLINEILLQATESGGYPSETHHHRLRQ